MKRTQLLITLGLVLWLSAFAHAAFAGPIITVSPSEAGPINCSDSVTFAIHYNPNDYTGDLARFSIAMEENLIVSAGSKEAMYSPTISTDGRTLPYGLGWFVEEADGRRLIWHHGNEPEAYSSLLLIVPDEKLAFILLANSAAASSSFDFGQGGVLESSFAKAFLDLFAD